MVASLLAVFEEQIAWMVSPLGIGILVGGAFLIGSGLLGRIVLFVERELQIHADRRRRSVVESTRFPAASVEALSENRRAA